MTRVSIRTPVNRYAYKPYGLFIPYALANLFTFIIVVLGLFSYKHHGVRPDRKFQDLVVAAEDRDFWHQVKHKGSVTMTVDGGQVIGRAGTMEMTNRDGETQRKVGIFWWKGGRGFEDRRASVAATPQPRSPQISPALTQNAATAEPSP